VLFYFNKEALPGIQTITKKRGCGDQIEKCGSPEEIVTCVSKYLFVIIGAPSG